MNEFASWSLQRKAGPAAGFFGLIVIAGLEYPLPLLPHICNY